MTQLKRLSVPDLMSFRCRGIELQAQVYGYIIRVIQGLLLPQECSVYVTNYLLYQNVLLNY